MKRQANSDNDDNKDSITKDDNENKENTNKSKSLPKTPPPSYGSQDYWDERYKSHRRRRRSNNDEGTKEANKSSSSPEDKQQEQNEEENKPPNADEDIEDTLPGHAWYFSYDELRPLILPLILGRSEEETFDGLMESGYVEVEDSDDTDIMTNSPGRKRRKTSHDEHKEQQPMKNATHEEHHHQLPQDHEEEKKEHSLLHTGEHEEEENGKKMQHKKGDNAKTNENNSPIKHSDDDSERSKHLPKQILEVGCGDVPLGLDLRNDLLKMQSDTGSDARLVINKIVCCDYSETVINILKENATAQTNESLSPSQATAAKTAETEESGVSILSPPSSPSSVLDPSSCLEVDYIVADARELPYGNDEFHLVMEKGTLDAMLSDVKMGVPNCVNIVSEMARVLIEDGYLVIVSHLNANTTQGLSWLDEVVVPGLRAGGGDATWEIEIHGSDGNDGSDDDEDDDEGEGDNDIIDDDDNDMGDGDGEDTDEDEDCVGQEGEESANTEYDAVGTKTLPSPLGPAVYIIRKMPPLNRRDDIDLKDEKDTALPPTIPLRFFTY
mmetsp:Transcript_12688/g.16960  ORF Transcript_12688/g.16960 Transcript_12688/m.16960 type:complete len:553 (+) Transcript_12688:111-1769(+)